MRSLRLTPAYLPAAMSIVKEAVMGGKVPDAEQAATIRASLTA
jgi:hypothetical protein